MTPRERIRTAMLGRRPDRVPVWCQLSLEHIIRQGTSDSKPPKIIDDYILAECTLTKRYGFDGLVLYLPGIRENTIVNQLIEDWIHATPRGYPNNDLKRTDPEQWDPACLKYEDADFYSSRLAREILGNDYHIGGWTPDGFSRAVQWFPTIEDAMIGTKLDVERFKALVRYFEQESIAWAKAQIRFGGVESIHISSPYAGSSFISLETYQALVLPSLTRLAEALKPEPSFSYVHTCGFISDRLELLAASGVDGIECMDPPPLGDLLLSDAKKRVGNKVFLKGNLDSVNTLLLGKDQEVDQAILENLEAGKPGGGYILSTACSVAPGVLPERIQRLAQLSEQFGNYEETET
jgi:Uroporphyrinogen decarboxylase (URO-D)